MKSDVQRRVQKLIDGIVERGGEQGLQVAAYHKGKLIVDAWAGLANPAKGIKVDGDTLFPVFSTSKGIAASAIHILVERGILDYEAPISKYWPGFAKKGKGSITLRQALDHTAGLPHMPDCKEQTELDDWKHMCGLIEDLEPLWTPGAKTYYHAITYSWLVGEPAHLADGRDFRTIIKEEVSMPLGLEKSLFIGLPSSEDARVAVMESNPNPMKPLNAPPPPAEPDPIALRSIPPLVRPLENWINKTSAWHGCIPASNGIMTAKAIAKHYAALIGKVDGVRLISEETLCKALEGTKNGEPENVIRGLGYGLSGPAGNRGSSFGHGGAGGSIGSADRKNQLTIGMVKNRMETSAPELKSSGEQIVHEIRSALGLE